MKSIVTRQWKIYILEYVLEYLIDKKEREIDNYDYWSRSYINSN